MAAYVKKSPGIAIRRRCLTAAEVAQMLGIGVQTVYEMADRRLLPTIRTGAGNHGIRFPLKRLAEKYPDVFECPEAA